MRDILYAFRTFRRAPLAALTIVGTVGLGLGLVAVVFTFFSVSFLRVDAVPNPGELFAVHRPLSDDPAVGAWVPFKRPDYEALRRETSVFADAAAIIRGIDARTEGGPVKPHLVTGNFFQTLGVRAALGRTLLPDDDQRFAPRPVIVLSHKGWTRLFDLDPAAIGRRLTINGAPYEVVGVMPQDFRGLGIAAPDGWAPLGLVGQFRPKYAGREDDASIGTIVGRLKPGMSVSTAAAGLNVWAAGRSDVPKGGSRPPLIRLKPSDGTLSADVSEILLVFTPIFFAFGLVLMIGCANVANLLLARGISRQREIGIRLSLGASRRRIIRQLLTESLLLAFAAAGCGLAVWRLLLIGGLYAATSTMPPEIAEQVSFTLPAADWREPVFLFVGAIVSTVFFGLVPALQTTRLELVRTMRGEITRDARPGRARNVLIGIQVCASALLLISAAVFLRSAFAAASADPGLRTSDTVVIAVANEPLRGAILRELTAHPSVAVVAAASPTTFTTLTSRETAQIDVRFASSEYFTTLGIELVAGRGFTSAERTAESGVIVVSESVARRHWPNQNAVGQVVRLSTPSGTFTIVGVARDVGSRQSLLDIFTYRGVYLPARPETPGTALTVRVHGDPQLARRALLERLTKVDPALGAITTMQTMAGMEAYFMRIAFWVTAVLGGLALVLTLSGLFSVLSYLVVQRAKEIGVRMAIGATTSDVVGLVLSQLLRPVAVGLTAGAGLAAGLAIVLMASPAAGEIGGTVRVLDPSAYIGSLLLIVTACALAAAIPALRAARIDPIATLREE